MDSRRNLAVLFAAMCVAAASGTVIDGSYRIVVPEKRPLGVQNALEQDGKELASALKEGAGLDVEVVRSSRRK